jgi:DNA-binding transcriptional regulator YbjK
MEQPSRRTQVLDAAVRVLGGQGSRKLTHRAVDLEGGLPDGTTSNHFRTRDALVDGVLAHLAEVDGTPTTVVDLGTLDRDGLVRLIRDQINYLAGPARKQTLARFALFLESAWRPSLRYAIVAWRGRFQAMLAGILEGLGAPDPAGAARLLIDHIDGMLLHAVSAPDPMPDPEPAVRRLIDLVLG